MNQTLKSNLFAGILIIVGIFGGLCLSIIFSFLNVPMPLILVASQILLLLIPACFYFIITKAPVKKTLRLNWPGWPTVLFSFLIAIFVQPFMMVLSALSSLFFTNDVANLISELDSYPTLLLIAVIALTPAICEEITMRGILLSGYDEIDIKKTMLLNGLFFGMLHLNLQQFLYAFALGALFAYMVRLTNSIIPSMVAHFTINGSQVLLQKFLIFITKFTNEDITALTQEPTFAEKLISLAAVFVFALLITPVAGILIYALRNLYSKKNLKAETTREPLEVSGQYTLIESEDVYEGQETVIEPLETSGQKVFNWPVWVSIGLYIAYMGFTLVLEHLLSYL